MRRPSLPHHLAQTYVRIVPGNWRDGFEYAYTRPDPEPDGPGLAWRETGANYWSGSSGSQPRGTVMLETSGLWVAYVRLEDPPGVSPITTVGRYATTKGGGPTMAVITSACAPAVACRHASFQDGSLISGSRRGRRIVTYAIATGPSVP
jgi:hypothetical protein